MSVQPASSPFRSILATIGVWQIFVVFRPPIGTVGFRIRPKAHVPIFRLLPVRASVAPAPDISRTRGETTMSIQWPQRRAVGAACAVGAVIRNGCPSGRFDHAQHRHCRPWTSRRVRQLEDGRSHHNGRHAADFRATRSEECHPRHGISSKGVSSESGRGQAGREAAIHARGSRLDAESPFARRAGLWLGPQSKPQSDHHALEYRR